MGEKKIAYGHGNSSSLGYSANNTIYDYDTEGEKLKKNLSKVIAKDMENQNGKLHYYCRGKVVEVYKSPNFASHILVDTRTLGTTGYKRRIMVGDNLTNKTIYSDIPDDYLNFLAEKTNGARRIFISAANSSNMVFSDGYVDGDAAVQIDYPNDRSNFYLAWLENEEIHIHTKSEQLQINFPDGNVATIDDSNESYRHLYIEDNKIRPVQVGDVITRNTKFYFTIPDNIFEQLPQGRDDVIILNNGESISLNADSFSSGIYFNTTSGMDTNMNIIVVINNKLMVNKSTMQNISYNGDYFEGTVSEVNSSSPVYSMIFVDITTLG